MVYYILRSWIRTLWSRDNKNALTPAAICHFSSFDLVNDRPMQKKPVKNPKGVLKVRENRSITGVCTALLGPKDNSVESTTASIGYLKSIHFYKCFLPLWVIFWITAFIYFPHPKKMVSYRWSICVSNSRIRDLYYSRY